VPLLVAACSPLPTAEPPATGHYAAVHGLRMYYERHGHGEPLLLLPGRYRVQLVLVSNDDSTSVDGRVLPSAEFAVRAGETARVVLR
jgi:hypothetical protein